MPTMNRLLLLCACALFALPGATARAQSARYELGQRLRAFEAAWEKQTDADARRRCIAPLTKAAVSFYGALIGGDFAEAGRSLDGARFALAADKAPEAAVLWAAALYVRPATRLLDVGADELAFSVEAFYGPVKGGRPRDATLRLTLIPADAKAVSPTRDFPLKELPLKAALPLKGLAGGQHTLRMQILSDDKVLAENDQGISVAADAGERLAKLRKAVDALPRTPATTDTETARSLLGLLTALSRNEDVETNYPAARLLPEAEAVAAAVKDGKTYYGGKKPGQFWLTLPTGKAPTAVRLLAPEAVTKGKELPLVIALHGVGASENMFFDACGQGAIVPLCEKRGWLLVAPRTTGIAVALGTKGPPIAPIMEEVDRLYPVDKKRVFVLGHSMGAKQAVDYACEAPERFAAVAALGGGRPVKTSTALKKLPFYVGVGNQDIFLPDARKLGADLIYAGVEKLRWREYPDTEHLVEVRVALAEVFAFFDEAARAPRR
jgi:predicted esterase